MLRKLFRFIKKNVMKLFRIDRQIESLQNEIQTLQEHAGKQAETITQQTEAIKQQDETIIQHTAIIKQRDETIKQQYETIIQHTAIIKRQDKTIKQKSEDLTTLQITNNELYPYKKTADVFRKMSSYTQSGDSTLINELVYNDLLGICDFLGAHTYKSLLQNHFDQTERELRKCEKIYVGFMFTLPQTWCFDSLYWEMEKNKRFEPYVIVLPPYDMPENYTYAGNVQAARDRGYRIIETFDNETSKYLPFTMLEQLHIVFHQIPYALYPEQYTVENFPLRILNVYVPYAVESTNVKSTHHLPAYKCYWKNLCETDVHIAVRDEILELGNFNAMRCGIPMMDPIYNGTLPTVAKKKKFSIIWAPHHTVPREDLDLPVSTFDWNKDFFLEYAASHSETYWYIRPHPMLCSRSVAAGLFEDEHEYYTYLDKWAALENAELALDRDFLELFALSDMMITDCVGFLTDYLFFNKPMLRLNRGEPEDFWNEYGNLLISHIATVRGDDFPAIEAFIAAKPPIDKTFFDEHLNYYKQNGNKTAAQYFVEYLEDV